MIGSDADAVADIKAQVTRQQADHLRRARNAGVRLGREGERDAAGHLRRRRGGGADQHAVPQTSPTNKVLPGVQTL